MGLPSFSRISDILADPVTPTTIYAAVRRLSGSAPGPSSGVYKSVDGGTQWEERRQGLPTSSASPEALAINPGHPGTLYAGDLDGVYRSTNGAIDWQAVNSAPANLPIRALAVQPANGAVFAGAPHVVAEEGDVGVLRSQDDGESWSSEMSGLDASFISSLVSGLREGQRLVVSTDSQGILASDDDGGSWQPAGEGITGNRVGPLTRDPHAPETLYTVAGESRFLRNQAYRSTDAAATWQLLGPPFEDDLGPLVVDGVDASTLYVASAGRIFRSTTAGTQWSDVSGRICGANLTVAADPIVGSQLVAGCVEDSGAPVSPPIYNSFLLQSTDGGSTWRRVFDGPTGAVFANWFISFDDGLEDLVFAGLSGLVGGGAFFSRDRGGFWFEIEPLKGVGVQALVSEPEPLAPGSPRQFFAGTSTSGVLQLIEGSEWVPFNEGLTGRNVRSLVVDPSRERRIWAATGGAGVQTLDHVTRLPCTESATIRCLLDRFQVEVEWSVPEVAFGQGTVIPLPDVQGSANSTTAAFWFFQEENPELAVKILDGRSVNGSFWVFYSGLSTVRYTLKVTDSLTGQRRFYENLSGRVASAGDTRAFPVARAIGSSASLPFTEQDLDLRAMGDLLALSAEGLQAQEAGSSLLLLNDRFQVDVQWDLSGRGVGFGTGVPLTPQSGALWFFRPENLEVFVKILDGRPVNGRFWLFFGALSNLGFELTVTDTQSGLIRSYIHPPGTFGSVVDVMAF